MWRLLFDNKSLPPAKIHLVLQAALCHILVSSNGEASLCNHSLLLVQVLLGAVWQILSGIPLCHYPEQTSDMNSVRLSLSHWKVLQKNYTDSQPFWTKEQSQRTCSGFHHLGTHLKTPRGGDKEIKLECEITKADHHLYQIHFVSAKWVTFHRKHETQIALKC